MAWVWHRSQAKGMTRLVALAIADHASDDGTNAWPSIARLAQMCACSPTTVRRSIRELVDLGELTVERQGGGPRDMRDDRRPNRYTICFPQPVDNSVDGVSLMAGRDGHGVSNTTPRGVTVGTLTVLEPSSSKSDAVSTVRPRKTVDNVVIGEWMDAQFTEEQRVTGLEMLARIRQARRETALNARSGESEGTPVPDTWHPSRGA